MRRNTVNSSNSRSDRLLSRLRPRSIYDAMAAIACIAALGTGTAYAANTIGSADIIDESILSTDIKNNALTGADINESALGQVPRAATAGSAPVSGLMWTRSELIVNPAKTWTVGTVACPAGKSATGGGFWGAGLQSLQASLPDGNGWYVRVHNAHTTASSFYVYAVCVDVPASAAG